MRRLKIEIRKTNLECPLESMKPKNGWGKRRLDSHSVRRSLELSHSLQTCYLLRRGRMACIVLQVKDLYFKMLRIRENLGRNEAARRLGILEEQEPDQLRQGPGQALAARGMTGFEGWAATARFGRPRGWARLRYTPASLNALLMAARAAAHA